MSTHYVIPTWDVASLPVAGSSERFPVRRIFCVGRNYLEHQKEMGSTEREEPFFFCKAPHGLVAVNEGENKGVHYGLMSQNYHWETELVAVLSKGGYKVKAADANSLIWGYAISPQDMWDLDEPLITPLIDIDVGGQSRKVAVKAARNGWLDLDRAKMESLTSIRRAGARRSSSTTSCRADRP